MKQPERFPPDDPREWINRARSNLAIARTLVSNAYFEDLCFDAQQAAEKAIKAVMIRRGIDFPYIHDLERLLTILKSDGQAIPEELWRAVELTVYATITRYPGTAPVSAKDHAEAIEIAEMVLRWAEDQI
ncbi:MAG: HEPN domain-containing protein [Gemmatimonadetes bacterium]|nr:HEPN domain-containing protein [Gemmatimonadota bacterium]